VILDYFEGKHYGITTKDWITSGLLVVGNSMRNRFPNVYSHLKQVLVTS
jgi:ribose 1,5-bisphosphokinase PhnN